METHPDLSVGGSQEQKRKREELFKRISHAHSILINDKSRHQHNVELDNPMTRQNSMDYSHHNGHHDAGARRNRHPPRGGFFMNGPRNGFMTGVALGLMVTFFVPWESLHKQLRPEHRLISRELVRPRSKD